MIGEHRLAEADPASVLIDDAPSAQEAYANRIQVRARKVPELYSVDFRERIFGKRP